MTFNIGKNRNDDKSKARIPEEQKNQQYQNRYQCNEQESNLNQQVKNIQRERQRTYSPYQGNTLRRQLERHSELTNTINTMKSTENEIPSSYLTRQQFNNIDDLQKHVKKLERKILKLKDDKKRQLLRITELQELKFDVELDMCQADLREEIQSYYEQEWMDWRKKQEKKYTENVELAKVNATNFYQNTIKQQQDEIKLLRAFVDSLKLKLTQNNIKFETQSNDGVRNITQKLQLLSLKPRESTKRTLKELYAQEQEESHNKFTAQKFDLTKQAREEAKFLKGTNYDMIPLSKNQSYLNDPQITKQRMNINPFTRLLKQEEDQRKNSLQENSITKSENLRNPFIQNPDIQQLSSYHQRDSQSSQFTQKKSPGTSQGGFSFNMKPSGSIQTLGMNEQAEMQFRDQYQRYLQDQKNSEKYAQQNNSTSQLQIHRQQKESKAQGFSHQNHNYVSENNYMDHRSKETMSHNVSRVTIPHMSKETVNHTSSNNQAENPSTSTTQGMPPAPSKFPFKNRINYQ
eukprot:403341548